MAAFRIIHGEILSSDSGTKDFTRSIGFTPTGYLIWISHAGTLNTPAANAGMGIGGCDGTNQACIASFAGDGVSPSQTNRASRSTAVAVLGNTSDTIDCELSHNAMIADGVRLNIVTAPAATRRIVILVWDFGCHLDIRQLGNVVETVTDGFARSLILGFTIGRNSHGIVGSTTYISLGASNTDLQRAVAHTSVDGAGSSATSSITHTTEALVQGGSTAPSAEALYTNGGATTYDINPGNDWSSKFVMSMSLDTGSQAIVKMGTTPSPISAAANWNEPEDLGMQPQVALFICCQCPTTDDTENGSNAGLFGIAGADEDGIEFCCYLADEDAQNPSDTESGMADRVLKLPLADGTGGWDASNMQFTSSGWTIASGDIAAANGTERQWVYVAIQTVGPVFTPGPLIADQSPTYLLS